MLIALKCFQVLMPFSTCCDFSFHKRNEKLKRMKYSLGSKLSYTNIRFSAVFSLSREQLGRKKE
jgi:hypothetical protein